MVAPLDRGAKSSRISATGWWIGRQYLAYGEKEFARFRRGQRLVRRPSGQPHHLENALGIAIERHHGPSWKRSTWFILETGRRRAPDNAWGRRRKAPAGEDRGFCGLPVCRSDRPIRIVGGHNDAAAKMPQFYRNCKSDSGKLTTNCIRLTIRGSGAAIMKPTEGK